MCHICGYLDLEEAPWGDDGKSPSYNICDCCGVEFGYEDYQETTLLTYRNEWIQKGANWFNPALKPDNWSLKQQLNNIGIQIE